MLNVPNVSQITVARTKNTKNQRVWDKKIYCPFCPQKISKFAEHIIARHMSEKEVYNISCLEKNSSPRKKEIAKLRDLGNYLHNVNVVQEKKGEIVFGKRPSQRSNVDLNRYSPCNNCYKFLITADLWRHHKKCLQVPRNGTPSYNRQQHSKNLLPVTGEAYQWLKDNVIPKMNSDALTLALKNDNLILAFGCKLYTKHSHEKHLQVQYISQKMRELARFLLSARAIDSSIKTLSDCMNAKKFLTVTAAVRKLCVFDKISHKFENPHLAMKIGHSLNHCANILLCQALMKGD